LDEKYLTSAEVAKLKEQARGVLLLINGYLRYLRSRGTSVRETGDEEGDFADTLDALPL